jgi:hypothetical protein
MRLMRFASARVCFLFALVAASSVGPALADRESGAWLSPSDFNWPLVAVHGVMTPDGRVLMFGSDASGYGTGDFQYEVWDPEAGLGGGHLTLQNLSLVDISCGDALTLPDSGGILIAGGANWTRSGIDNLGNASATPTPSRHAMRPAN